MRSRSISPVAGSVASASSPDPAIKRARIEHFREHDVFRRVFKRVVASCIRADLVGGNGFAVDASLIAADANKCGSTPGEEWSRDIGPATAERAVQDYLAKLVCSPDRALGSVSPPVISKLSDGDPGMVRKSKSTEEIIAALSEAVVQIALRKICWGFGNLSRTTRSGDLADSIWSGPSSAPASPNAYDERSDFNLIIGIAIGGRQLYDSPFRRNLDRHGITRS